MPSADNTRCVTCPATTGTGAKNTAIGDCDCGDGWAAVDIGINGELLTIKECVECASDTYPGPHGL